MSLTLAEGEQDVRVLTRHENDTIRLTSTIARSLLMRRYRALRTWLQDIAPELYLVCSGEITVGLGDSVQLASSTATFEKLHRIEMLIGDSDWRPMERADSLEVNFHISGRYTFRVEGACVKFGPRNDFSGTVRLLYHATPPDLVGDDDLFHIPVELEDPLRFQTCGLVALRDGDGAAAKKEWDGMADDILFGEDRKSGPGSAAYNLAHQHGIHTRRAGLQRVMGY